MPRTYKTKHERDDSMAKMCVSKSESVVWLCRACGKTGPTRDRVGDESCYLHAVEVLESSIERDAEGRIVRATASRQLSDASTIVATFERTEKKARSDTLLKTTSIIVRTRTERDTA